MVLEHVLTEIGAVVRITYNGMLGSELHGMVDECRKIALEQMQGDGHLGWSVLEWEAASLHTYLLAQVIHAARLSLCSTRRFDSIEPVTVLCWYKRRMPLVPKESLVYCFPLPS